MYFIKYKYNYRRQTRDRNISVFRLYSIQISSLVFISLEQRLKTAGTASFVEIFQGSRNLLF